jgi:gliding motility-associated-like protein
VPKGSRHITLFLTAISLLMMAQSAFSQRPTIKSLDKVQGANSELVTISGSNFGNTPNTISAFFGAVKGEVEFTSDQVLEVRVPSGASYGNISIVNTGSSLTGYSKEFFMPSFGGESGLLLSELDGQKDFDAEHGLYDLCSCDFNGDSKADILTTTGETGVVALFINRTASPGLENISFDKMEINVGAPTAHAKCGDLNGDGKPDIIIGEGNTNEKIFILENTSNNPNSASFIQTTLALPGRKVNRLEISDLDNDGKPEIVFSKHRGKSITILPNTSDSHSLSFSVDGAMDLEIPVEFEKGTDGITVADLNSDDTPDIIVTQLHLAESGLFIFSNQSAPGNFSFAPASKFTLTGNATMLKTADLDNDRKPDIVATLLLGSSVAIFKNETSGNEIRLADPQIIATDERPYGVDFGDLDGDGKVDIAVASVTKRSVTVLNNNSTTNALNFTKLVKETSFINCHISIGDIDTDGKPDIAFTSIDDNNLNIPASKLSIFRNKHCLIPRLTPEGPHVLCSGKSVDLFATPSTGLTYEWRADDTIVDAGENTTYTADVSGLYKVIVTSTVDAGCTFTSNEVEVTVETTSPLASEPQINDLDPVCIGATVSLSAVDIGASAYKWKGPNGYEATGLTANPPIADFKRQNAGRYFLEVLAGSCVSEKTSVVVSVFDSPEFRLTADDMEIICDGKPKKLTINPQPAQYTFQWYEVTQGLIEGAIDPSLTVTENGSYYAKAITTPECASGETPKSKIIFADGPVAAFEAPGTACPGQTIAFSNLSTGVSDLDLFYTWDLGDGTETHDQNLQHIYALPSSYDVTLKVAYDKGSCSASVNKTIVVDDSPAVVISSENEKTNLCPDETLTLIVEGSFATYHWETGEQTAELTIDKPGVYAVNVSSSAGCEGSGSIEIGVFPEPVVNIQAQQPEINEGESVLLIASGLQNYEWRPIESVDSPESATTAASPLTSTMYTVSGTDQNGCTGESQIEIFVKADQATKKITPSKFFSPNNGDDINNVWSVDKILNYPRCGVAIFDDKGVKVYEAKPYLNDWDGTYHGKTLPDGVYFYMIVCDGEENSPKTGSITIIR